MWELWPWWRTKGEWLSSGSGPCMVGIILSELCPDIIEVFGASLAEIRRNLFRNRRAAPVYETGDASFHKWEMSTAEGLLTSLER